MIINVKRFIKHKIYLMMILLVTFAQLAATRPVVAAVPDAPSPASTSLVAEKNNRIVRLTDWADGLNATGALRTEVQALVSAGITEINAAGDVDAVEAAFRLALARIKNTVDLDKEIQKFTVQASTATAINTVATQAKQDLAQASSIDAATAIFTPAQAKVNRLGRLDNWSSGLGSDSDTTPQIEALLATAYSDIVNTSAVSQIDDIFDLAVARIGKLDILGKHVSQYTGDEQTKSELKTIIDQAKEEIVQTDTISTIKAIFAVADTKADKIKRLVNWAKDIGDTNKTKTEMANLIREGRANITNASDVSAINDAFDQAVTKINEIKDLVEARANRIARLNNWSSGLGDDTQMQQQIDQLVQKGIDALNEAENLAQIDQVFQDTINAINAVRGLPAYKNDKKEELAQKCQSLVKDDYTEAAWATAQQVCGSNVEGGTDPGKGEIDIDAANDAQAVDDVFDNLVDILDELERKKPAPAPSTQSTTNNYSQPSGDNVPNHARAEDARAEDAERKTCAAWTPVGQTELFQISRQGSKATLYFTPVRDYTSGYHVTFGHEAGDERYGGISLHVDGERNNGVLAIEIGNLDLNQAYSFKVAPVNDCAVGSWSNWLTIPAQGNNKVNSYLHQ